MQQAKLQKLASLWGMSVSALLHSYATDSLAPAICTNEGCGFLAEYEPDCRDGWCQECKEKSVVSAYVLGELI